MSHAPTTPPLTEALKANDPMADVGSAAGDEDIDLSLVKKKKKKTPKPAEDEEGGDEAGADDGLDLSMKKKKKKKVKIAAAEPSGGDEDDFAAKIKSLEIDDKADGKDSGAGGAGGDSGDGDMEQGTGIWQPDETKSIGYSLVLGRLYKLLLEKDPEHAMGGQRSYKIVPPQCMREGNKKTIFTNIADMCARMRRTEEHVTAYLFAELGTTGSVDGSRRLVIKGRFQQKQIENVLRKYLIEYVTCKTCKSPDTDLSKGENRLYFLTCNSCGSRRSVSAIKTGFSAQVGKRRKQKA